MAGCGQYVKMFITLETYGMFESYFANLLLYYCPATGMQNGDEALPSIIMAG